LASKSFSLSSLRKPNLDASSLQEKDQSILDITTRSAEGGAATAMQQLSGTVSALLSSQRAMMSSSRSNSRLV